MECTSELPTAERLTLTRSEVEGGGAGAAVVVLEVLEPQRRELRHFVGLVEGALRDNGLPVYTSEKALSKRMRWL